MEMRFRRSLEPSAGLRRERTKKAPPEVVAEVMSSPDKRDMWMQKYISGNFDWATVTASFLM